MKKARFFRIFCPVLLVLAIAALTVGVLATASPRVRITHMGSEISGLLLSQEEKTALNAECDRPSSALRWQILADAQEQLWVDIHGASESTLTLSYALVGSLLDNSGSAYIRCAATVDGAPVVSEPVCVTVAYTAQSLSAAASRLSAPVRSSPVTQEDAPSAGEYIQITINYLDAVSDLPIYTPYYAQIEAKKAYASDVISPTYLGYAPYYNKSNPESSDALSTDDASIVHISLDDTHEAGKYIVNVYYKAIDVPYAVRYFFQNINDDLYTENSDLYWVGTAKTGTIIDNSTLTDPVADRVRGFTKLYHYPEAVAADGSTVFECYYDRNYYMLKFDAAGGHGTETIYARYGTPFVALDPTRYGYKFMGWDSDGDGKADEVPATVPTENRSYTAIWVPDNANYKVVYWLSHADDSGYAYIGSRLASAPSDSTVNGSDDLTKDTYICGYADGEDGHSHTDDCKPADFRHYVFDRADQNVTVKGDGSTIVNVYYKRKEYTLRFFYAKATTSNGSTSYQVIGGSTYSFGNTSFTQPNPYTIENLLDQVPTGNYGKVKELPVFTTEYQKLLSEKLRDKWRTGTVTSTNGFVFHYFSITLPYGADLTELWPGEAFQTVEVDETHTANGADKNMGKGQWGNYAYLAGWNGEFKVKYSVDNANSTVKGMYQLLDDNLLYDKQYGTADTVNFIGFFDNGADINWSVPRQWIYKIYIPKLSYDENAGTDVTRNGITYRLLKTVYTTDDNTMDKAGATAPYGQTQPTLLGFTADGWEFTKNDSADDGRDSFTARFFYKRNTYKLTLHNHGELISNDKDKLDNVVYNAVLTEVANFEPPYPASLEAGAYRFVGWYYSQDGYAGSELGETDTMPAHNLSLYAKWVPVEHTLRFFKSYDQMLQYERGDTQIKPFFEELVTHRSYAKKVDETPTDPSGNNYIFAGWFYLKNGEKTAFDPFDMEVTSDMHLFADWSSQVPQPFLIHYSLYIPEKDNSTLAELQRAAGDNPEDNAVYHVTVNGETKRYVYLDADKGYHLCIADDSSGFAYEGSTRTYYPKAGDPMNQLYTEYNSGYYPTLASHSITIAPEDDKTAPKANVFTFTYVYAQEISYKVEYRYAATSQLIDPKDLNGLKENPVTKTTQKAVITERFHVVENYIPDAFYKRLILSVTVDKDGNVSPSKDNVITFYYTKNTSKALYVVHHLMQKLGTDGTDLDKDFEEIDARIEGIADINSTHSITPQTFSGFTVMNTARVSNTTTESYADALRETDGTFSITVSQEGTELYLYYTRNTQSYKVYHLRHGTDISDLSKLKYTDGTDDVLAQIQIMSGKYGETVIVGKKDDIQGFNCVSAPVQSIVLRNNDESNYIIFYYAPLEYTAQYLVWSYGGGTLDRTLEVVRGGSFQGSTPTALAGYRFDGWFTDASCTTPVADQALVDNATNRLTPKTEAMRPAPETNIYYAKFVPDGYGSLTITRQNTEDESDGEQVFVYRITAVNDPSYVTYVTIMGDGSVTVTELPCRDYTVEQLNTGWSWRYADQSQKASITKDQMYTCTFGCSAANGKWLSGNAEPWQNQRGKD